MHFATKSVLAVALVAGCTQSQETIETLNIAENPTAGVYTSFSSKGGGQVLGDTFVRPLGVDPDDVRVSTVPGSSRSCWDGSSGSRLGPLLFCPPKPPVEVVVNEPETPVVVTPPTNNPPTNNPPTDTPPTDTPPTDTPPTDTPPTDTPPTDTPPTDNPPSTFTDKYHRLQQVYGTTNWQSLPEVEQTAIRDFFRTHGQHDDWSTFNAAGETSGDDTAGGDVSGDDTTSDDTTSDETSTPDDSGASDETSGEEAAAGDDTGAEEQGSAADDQTDEEV